MNSYRTTVRRGFTLVEILIVVIILGILAAIVIPQFTNASQDARKNSLTSQLQTLRSQLELYKLQHLDALPTTLIGSTPVWTQLTSKTDNQGNVGTTSSFPFGPYLQADPINPLNGAKLIKVVTADVTPGGASGCTSTTAEGFIINSSNGKMWGTSAKFTKVYNEANASDANNDL
jgi:general secretion pathway protein G